jgi:hypothetical protein
MAKTKAKDSKKSGKKSKKGKPAVPVAGKRDAQNTTADLLGKLASKTKPKTSSSKKKDRLVLSLSEDDQKAVVEYVELKTVYDLAESAFTPVKNDAKEVVFTEFAKLWFNSKNQPQNPTIEIHKKDGQGQKDIDHRAMFILQEKFYPHLELDEDSDPAEVAVKELVDMGVDPAKAKEFVENELDFDPEQSLRSFNELTKGHKGDKNWIDATDAEKAAANKLLMFVLGQDTEPLTDDERDLVVQIKPNCTIKPGIYARLRGYCEKESDLKALISLLNPVYFLTRSKFAVSSTPVERNQRLVEVVAGVLGMEDDDAEDVRE